MLRSSFAGFGVFCRLKYFPPFISNSNLHFAKFQTFQIQDQTKSTRVEKVKCQSELINLRKMSANANPAKTALVVIADGSEEIEAVTQIDVLRRAGINVTVAGLEGAKVVNCSRNVNIIPDLSFQDAIGKGPFDVIILPGGLKGSDSFGSSAELGTLLKEQEKSGRLISAICAAPTALKKHGIAFGKSITSYPSTKEFMVEGNHYNYKEDRVVVDGTLITSRGPGTSLEFALAIVESLVGQPKAQEIAKGVLLKE